MSNTYTRTLKTYSCDPKNTKGRLFVEKDDAHRDCYQHDRDRVIHSGAFRKLEYKTQVFVNYEGDYYRTRLTHSLEVAQVARSLSRSLGLNEDLAEAISLAHDLGHTPFGHAGEEALNCAMSEFGGFDHNAQTLRILTKLERKYASFDGLNLTWEMIEGIAKHNGPIIKSYDDIDDSVHKFVIECDANYSLRLDEFATIEAQIAAISDDIAYNIHDIDDGIRAGFFVLDELLQFPLVNEISKNLFKRYPGLTGTQLRYEILRKIMSIMIEDVIKEVSSAIKSHGIVHKDEIRVLGMPIVQFSVVIKEFLSSLKIFLRNKFYQYYTIRRMTNKAKCIVKQLFDLFYSDIYLLPEEWSKLALASQCDNHRAIIVCDFIAGMTDRFAIQEHRRIFDSSYEIMSF